MWESLEPVFAEALATLTVAAIGWLVVVANRALAEFKQRSNIDLGRVKLEMDALHRDAIKQAAATFVRAAGDAPDTETLLLRGRQYIKKTMPEAIAWHEPPDSVLDQILNAVKD